MHKYYIGLMSGTSMDAVDAVLVDFHDHPPRLVETHSEPMPPELKMTLQTLCQPGADEINRMGHADVQVGRLFAKATQTLLTKAAVQASDIKAIGSHGQTIRHTPNHSEPFTLQIGDPNIIATLTGITTIADFRRRDIAAGGQGAPFAPAFHDHVLRDTAEDRVILNIGGIANITVLPAEENKSIRGFDTGPGNTLMDQWYQQHQHADYDAQGQWAAEGRVDDALLQKLLADPYFEKLPPKSTGREYFHQEWLADHLDDEAGATLAPVNVQATLAEFTAHSILKATQQHGPSKANIFVCGGGAHNAHLMQRLQDLGIDYNIKTTAEIGIDPDWLEAMAFAWFAKQTLHGIPIDLTQITGSHKPIILGGIYQ